RDEYGSGFDDAPSDPHYSYEDEDQSAASPYGRQTGRQTGYAAKKKTDLAGLTASGSMDNIADFFASRGKKFVRPKLEVQAPAGKVGFKAGQRVRHPKYGEGVVYRREGEGEEAKLTVQFPKFGMKKLVEKFAQLERV